MTLLALQHDFREALLAEDFPVMASFGDDATDGLSIYRNAYRGRLMACLRTSFDKVWTWVGDEAFAAAACHHVILHPPHSWTLDDYGDGFDQTLVTLFPDDPEVPEVAWLEWAMARAFASLDEPIVKPDNLTSGDVEDCDWDTVRLDFVDSLQLREIGTNCTGIWLAITDESDPPELIMLDASATLAVWRKEFSPQFRVLEPGESGALSMMLNGATFGQLCEKMAEHLGADEAVPAAGTMLGRWVGEEMIASLRTGSV